MSKNKSKTVVKVKEKEKEKEKLGITVKADKTKRIVVFSLLVVIEIVLSSFSINFGNNITPTLALLPIIIACAVCGLGECVGLGAVMGFTMLIKYLTWMSGHPSAVFFSPLAPNGTWFSLFIVIVPRLIFPIIIFYLYKLILKFSKKTWSTSILTAIAAMVATLCHTIMVVSGIFIIKKYHLYTIDDLYFYFVLASISINVVIEVVSAGIIGSIVPVRLRKVLQPNES